MSTNYLCVLTVACLALAGSPVWAQSTPNDAVADAIAASDAFPAGTSVVSVVVDEASAVVELSEEAAPTDLGDSQADAMVKAIVDALAIWPEISAIEVTVAGKALWEYLPRPTGGEGSPVAEPMKIAAPKAEAQAMLATTSSELSGKLVVLHPSHGSYWHQTYNYWYRAMRTLCGPNPSTNLPPGWTGSTYQPSDYYFWTAGYQWGSFYEDDMSPETIRFLAAYVGSSGAEVWVSRNLDKNAGNFDYNYYGYPNCSFPLPKWQTAAKYYLQDRGDVPEWVWNEPALTAQTDKDIRARPYYANYRMAEKYPGQDQSSQAVWGNCVSFSLHSNAAGSGTARGTETFWYTTTYPHLQTAAQAYCTAVQAKVINAIKNQYDGFWAESMYPVGTTPVEWPSGTYYGYEHDGSSIPGGTTGWQDRGVKTTNMGEIREAKMPAQLMELAFHDDWKFYPDHVFMMDQIFRSTVAWGMYEGMCQYWGITPKSRLAAELVSVNLPSQVAPGEAISGTITMRNLGQAWCWGHKFDTATKVYGAYTVWKLAATANEQIAPGMKIELASSAVVYPGETAEFAVSMTAPTTCGTYTTEWQMLKDDARGGAFGDLASTAITVGAAPEVTISSPVPADYPHGCVSVQFEVTDVCNGSVEATIDDTPVSSGESVCGLSLGSHTLTVTATNVLGSDIKDVTFTISFGDFDLDDDVDLTDFALFAGCFNGPNRAPATSGCEVVDYDGDSDVDLGDFSMFATCFNGPNRPPACQ
ncbi:MAG: GerMN domain-containing protein [Phycisphaerae bacterium]|nr:GerMN domain-containing protein [Phycisphaerae bacterium]